MVQYSDFLDNFNVTALQEFVSWEQIQEFSEQNNIKPDSTLALASFIGMLMMAQQYTMSKNKDFIPPSSSILEERIGNRRKLRRRRKRKKKVTPNYQKKNKWQQNNWVKNLDFDYNYPDFYDDKNYEYIDDVDVEKIKLNFENNRKISSSDDLPAGLAFDFKAIDYDDYEFEEVGLLNFNKPPKYEEKSFGQKLSKRKMPSVQIVRRRRPPPVTAGYLRNQRPSRPSYSVGLLRTKPRIGTSPFLQSLGSRFDFPSLAAIAGLWFVWQNYLVNLVPTTVLSDFVNSLGRANNHEISDDIIHLLHTFSKLKKIH